MNKVLEEYTNQVDFMYLFANDTVLDFYPRFGFIPAQEQLFSIDYTSGSTDSVGIRKLDGTEPDDLNFIRTFAAQRFLSIPSFWNRRNARAANVLLPKRLQ